jgi:putative transposase
MRSRTNSILTAAEVHQWALRWLMHAELLRTRRRWLCTPTMVWSIVLRAAAGLLSIYAACQDLADAPSAQAVFDALEAGLPQTLSVLERRLNDGLTHALPRRLRRRAWDIAIDWHLVPYYGAPHRSRNELYYGKPRQGTKQFHAYATACIVQQGQRYTLALTWVRRHESTVTALQRLLAQIRALSLKIKVVLLDRAFFNVPVTAWLQGEKLPFLLPVMFRGRPPKRRPRRGLHWIKRQKAGWYAHTLQNGRRQVTVRVAVAYRTHRQRKDGRRVQQKLLFGAWRVSGTPQEVRTRYRKRFGIETSYRQLRQARIYTCTRQPRLRLVFVAVALLLRNLWVWLHAERLRSGRAGELVLTRGRLSLPRMLTWIEQAILAEHRSSSGPYAELVVGDKLGTTE